MYYMDTTSFRPILLVFCQFLLLPSMTVLLDLSLIQRSVPQNCHPSIHDFSSMRAVKCREIVLLVTNEKIVGYYRTSLYFFVRKSVGGLETLLALMADKI